MATAREAQAYRLGCDDGIDAANADAPRPEGNARDVLERAWAAAEAQNEFESQTEREEYFVGWTHGYINRAEGIEADQQERWGRIAPRLSEGARSAGPSSCRSVLHHRQRGLRTTTACGAAVTNR
jgi:hypothetical protein